MFTQPFSPCTTWTQAQHVHTYLQHEHQHEYCSTDVNLSEAVSCLLQVHRNQKECEHEPTHFSLHQSISLPLPLFLYFSSFTHYKKSIRFSLHKCKTWGLYLNMFADEFSISAKFIEDQYLHRKKVECQSRSKLE